MGYRNYWVTYTKISIVGKDATGASDSLFIKFLRRYLPILLFPIFFSNILLAEGSKEINANGGNRAYLRSTTNTTNSFPFSNYGTIKVYVKAGETLYLGSSAQGVSSGTINLRAPNGATYTSGSSTTIGRINDKQEEGNGPDLSPFADPTKYTPFTLVVGASQEGVWEIDFMSPDPSVEGSPAKINANAAWTQANNTCYISAFDVSVRNTANTAFILGRAFTNVFNGSLREFDAVFNAQFNILTKDGYTYTVNNNGQAGNGFTFFANNKGFRDGLGNASYQSYNAIASPPVQDPRSVDTGTDVTHKIFFNTPSSDLPTVANVPGGGTTWLLNTPISPVVSNFAFTGKEGTANAAGTSSATGANAMGGTISFNANQTGSYEIYIDANQNGVFTDAVDRRLTGSATSGVNNIYWDGLSGQNTKVSGPLLGTSAIKVTLLAGEVHFPFIDVENNPGGIIITSTNGVGSGDNTVYWDDTNISAVGTASSPRSTVINGISSVINGHKWGSTAYNSNSFGENKGLDTWTYVKSAALSPSAAIALTEADLQVVSVSRSNTSVCLNGQQTYTVELRNNGPNNVVGSKFRFTYPAEFTGIAVTNTIAGTASVSFQNILATEYNSLLDINNGTTVTFTITGTVSALPAASLLNVQASILRPADVNDPDATNPDSAVPADAQIECDAAPSGTGCNNISTISSTPVVFRNITIADKTVTEGTGTTNNMAFAVSLSAASPCDITLDYAVSHITTDAADFAGTITGQVTIPAGSTTATVLIPVATDAVIEPNETFTVTISNPTSGGVITTSTATGTLSNDDAGAVLIEWVQHGSEPGTNPQFRVRFPTGITSSVPTSVNYSVAGTALAGTDFISLSGTVIIPAGSNSATIDVDVNDDLIIEGTETAVLTITSAASPLGGTVIPGSASANILDDDNTVANRQVLLTKTADGVEGGSNAQFTVSFPTGITTTVPTKVDYAIAGSAFNGTDYTGISGTVTIPAGANSADINILINDDLIIEGSETVQLQLSTVTNSLFTFTADPVAKTATIADNDNTNPNNIVTLSKISDGVEGAANIIYRLSYPAGITSSAATAVNYLIGGTAFNSLDYSTLGTSVTIPANSNYVDFTLTVLDDQIIEGTETVALTLTSATNPYSTISVAPNAAVTANIIDNDITIPSNVVTLTKVSDGAEPSGNAVFRVAYPIGVTAAQNTVITYNTAGTATNGLDYTALSGTVTIPAGDNEAFITVPVINDVAIEATETVQITLTSALNPIANPIYTIGSITANITDDDNIGPNTVITLTKQNDGAEPGTNALFKVSYPNSFVSSEPTTVFYSISGTATNGIDYNTLSGTIIIPAGQSFALIPVTVTDDKVIEGDETLALRLTSAINSISVLTVSPAIDVIATIKDDDNVAPNNIVTLSLVNHGAEPNLKAQFQVSFPAGITSSVASTVTYSIGGGATNGTDYSTLAGTVIIPAGINSAVIDINVIDDQIIEGIETVSLILTNAVNSVAALSLSPSTAVIADIADDDNAAPNNIVTLIKVLDGAEGGINPQFKISFPANVTSSVDTKVDYTIAGTAVNGTDYATISGTVTIAANSNSVYIDILLTDDLIIEGNENISLTLTAATNSVASISVAPNTAVAAGILDNDNTTPNNILTLTKDRDGAEPGTPGRFKVSFPTGITSSVSSTINYTIAGTAINGIDYSLLTGSVIIPAGDNSAYIDITVLDDQTIEPTETVSLTLTSATNSVASLVVSAAIATANIADDDNTAANNTVTLTKVSDGSEPATNAQFKVSFPTAISSSVNTTVRYSISGTAINGTDYAALSDSVIIPAGANEALINVTVADDQIIEATETVALQLNAATASGNLFTVFVLPGTPVTATVADNDNVSPNNIITLQRISHGAEPATNAVFRVSFPAGVTSSAATTISYNTNGTAINGTDYAVLSGTLTIPAGSNYADITATVLDDKIIEGTETVDLNLNWAANPFAALIVNPSATVSANINDDDNTVANMTVTLTKVVDGEEPANDGQFKVSFPTGITSSAATLIAYTVSGTAGAGVDYNGLAGIITIPAGSNSAVINVPVIDDNSLESTETVIITPGTITNSVASLTISNSPVTLNIIDDDTVSPANNIITLTKINDGSEPGTNPRFKVSYPTGKSSSHETVVTYTFTGTALDGTDFNTLTGTVTIPAEANSEIIEIVVKDDQIIEPTETVSLKLTSADNTLTPLTVQPGVAVTANIDDDDSALSTTNIVTLTKVDDGKEPTDDVHFKVSFPAGVTSAVDTKIFYAVGGTAASGTDFTALVGDITIPAGSTSITFPVTVINDFIIEGTETLSLTPTYATSTIINPAVNPGSAVVADIEDDDNTTTNNTILLSAVSNGGEPGTNARFKVSFPTNITTTVDTRVDYTIAGTATNGTDYSTLSGTVIIPAGSNSQFIDVQVIDDQIIEGTETVSLTLISATNSLNPILTVTPSSSISANITDDDNTGQITLTKDIDGAEPGNNPRFKVSMPAGKTSSAATIITYTDAGGTATSGADYQSLNGTVTIPAGDTFVYINVPTIDDQTIEPTETVKLAISAASNVVASINYSAAIATANISDDDATLNSTISIIKLADGKEPGTPAVFKVSYPTGITASTATVVTYTPSGTAQSGTDYSALSGTVIIPANTNSALITATVADDKLIEPAESLTLTLNTANNGIAAIVMDPASAIALIEDDDALVNNTITLEPVNNGSEPGTNARLKVRFPTLVTSTVITTVYYSVSGTASQGTDYTALSGSVTIPAGANEALIDILVTDDNIIEANETVVLTLTNAVSSIANPSITSANAVAATIADDDNTAANNTITLAKVADGAEPATNAQFKVSFPSAIVASSDTRVNYSIAGTAFNGIDYQGISGMAIIPGGQNYALIAINIIDDKIIEGNETVSLRLTSAANTVNGSLNLQPSSAVPATIIDDDNLLYNTITLDKVADGSEPGTNAKFIVKFPVGVTSSVESVVNFSVAGQAIEGTDYAAIGQTVKILPYNNSLNIEVPVIDDNIIENTETVELKLTSVVNSVAAINLTPPTPVSANILDNDNTAITISGPISVTEGNSGTVSATFNVKLEKETGTPFAVDFTTVDGTGKVSDSDYNLTTGTLNFTGAAGEVIPVTVIVNGDKKIENNESFSVILSNLSQTFGGRLIIAGSPAGATIVDDDNIASNRLISITKTNGTEGGASASFSFNFPPSVSADAPTTVSYTLSGVALSGSDYTGSVTGSVAISPGLNSSSLILPVVDDSIIEDSETLTLTTGSVTNSAYSGITVSNSPQNLTIDDNDYATLSISNAVIITEGNSGTTSATFTVTLDKASGSPFAVNFATVDGTATLADRDYQLAAGTLNFAGTAGETRTITVLVNGDLKIEGNETYSVVLNALSNSFGGRLTIVNSPATGTINDNDNIQANKNILISKTDGAEGGNTPSFIFSFLTGVSADVPTVISYTLTGQAIAGTDYSASAAGFITIPAGQNNAVLNLPVTDDAIIEDIEDLILTSNSVSNTGYPGIQITSSPQTLLVNDNDNASLSISGPVSVTEGNSGTKTITFNVKLNKATGNSFSVDYATADGTALVGDNDYLPGNGTLNFAGTSGETLPVSITINGDLKIEKTESFTLILSNLSKTFGGRLNITGSPATGTITDDDNIAANKKLTITKTDGEEAGTDANFTFSFPPGVSADVATTVSYILTGTAKDGVDYNNATPTSFTIPASQTSFILNIKVIDDAVIENTETLSLKTGVVANAAYTGISVANSPQSLNIIDNDITALDIAAAAITEGNAGNKNLVFSITLPAATGSAFSVKYNTGDGTATTSDNDYIAKSGTLNFSGTAGEVKTINIPVKGDIALEDDEVFTLSITGLSQTFEGKLTIPALPVEAPISNDDFAPVASPDNVVTGEDTPIVINLIVNDTDVDGTVNSNTITIINPPGKGKITTNGNGAVTYVPDTDYNGADSFTYTIKDNTGIISNEAEVSITVISVNDPPIANDDEFTLEQDTELKGECGCPNDRDPDGDPLEYEKVTEPLNGKAEMNLRGKLSYVPDAGFIGVDKFMYRVSDPDGASDTATITLNVRPSTVVYLTPDISITPEGKRISVTAELERPFDKDIIITLAYEGTAKGQTDYLLQDQSTEIEIKAGEISTTQKVTVYALSDDEVESDEDVQISIAATSDPYAKIGAGAKVTITDMPVVDVSENKDITPDPLVSANGDGSGNDFFKIENILSFSNNEVSIFNRWGNEVYKVKGYNESDRTFRGNANTGLLMNKNEPLLDGVYYYLIYTYRTINGVQEKKLNKGYLILKR